MFNTFKKSHSSFWLGNDTIYSDETDYVKAIKMAKHKRAITNFVNILTGESHQVKFQGEASYTDGDTITIGSDLKNVNYDETVGLALHEASHIKLSDFDLLKDLENRIPDLIYSKFLKLDYSRNQAHSFIKDILNIVEDRRIDNYIYTTSPGYRAYYKALYSKYFTSKIVSKMLESNKYRDETLESYLTRFMGLINTSTDINALKGLRKIAKILDIRNISRLENSEDTLKVAFEITQVVLKYVLAKKKEDENPQGSEQGQGQSGQGQSSESGNSQSDSNDSDDNSDSDSGDEDYNGKSNFGDETDDDSQTGSGSDSDGSGNGSGNDSDDDSDDKTNSDSGKDSDDDSKLPELTSNQESQLKKKLKEIKDFLNDSSHDKKKISQKMSDLMKTISNNGVEIKSVGSETQGYGSITKVDCIVYNKLDQQLIDNSQFSLGTSYPYSLDAVKEGIAKGKILGKKLQIRNETRSLMYNRQSRGKVDSRMIASAGFGYENIFEQTSIEEFNSACIHISIDSSGSMSGDKFHNAIVNAVSIAQAADAVGNMDVSISFRSTQSDGRQHLPMIVMAYDSKKDKISKISKLFPYLQVSGTTPEGLCFEAIMDMLQDAGKSLDSYFVNLSDGSPYYSGPDFYYSSDNGAIHTRQQVKKMEQKGMKILSYFVGDSSYENSTFIESYGRKNASFVDVANINDIAKTINKLMLKK